ncbi:hypothetical protein H2248_001526 [Termitomyces sp. 'cryptogamus']|nr:hypothetical protein H2248_001526 [Termitomyces sp. 'cryptogamus']
MRLRRTPGIITHTTGSISPMATDAAYPHICPAKLNAHWPTTIPPFDWATSKFMKWLNKLKIFLQQSGLDQYIFAFENKPDCLITEPSTSKELVAYANWLANNDLIVGIIRAAVSDV